MKIHPRLILPIVLSCVLVSVLVFIIRWFEFEDLMVKLLVWAETAGIAGQLILLALATVSVVALLPSVLLTLAAGFLYGPIYGSVLIVVGETLGALAVFGVTRTGLIQAWTTRLRNSGSLKVINLIMQTSGWELVAAIRMIPFFPFKLSNYLFGLSPVKTRDYLVGTLIGLWPITLFNTYLGSMAGDLMSLGTTERARTMTEWMILASGFAAVATFMLFAVTRAQRLLREHQINDNS